MSTVPTQPDPAEGPRPGDDPAAKPANAGTSSQDAAEGADDTAPPQPGSPRG